MALSVESIFETLWNQYIKINPQAQKIQTLLQNRGEEVINDHIALRTFNTEKLGIPSLAKVFLNSDTKKPASTILKRKS